MKIRINDKPIRMLKEVPIPIQNIIALESIIFFEKQVYQPRQIYIIFTMSVVVPINPQP